VFERQDGNCNASFEHTAAVHAIAKLCIARLYFLSMCNSVYGDRHHPASPLLLLLLLLLQVRR
jgi:hypothetical protein